MDRKLRQILGVHVGFLFDNDPDTPHHAATLTVAEDEIKLEIALLDGHSDGYEAWFRDDHKPPEDLYFVTSKHSFHLAGARARQRNINFGVGVSLGTIRFLRLVRTGAILPSYKEIHGLQTGLVGLAGWIKRSGFSQDYETDDAERISAVTYRAERVEPLRAPGTPVFTLRPHFETEHDGPNGEHSIRETVVLQTRYSDPVDWNVHAVPHRALQDLVSLVYWYPCDLTTKQALRLEDEVTTLDGEKHGIEWHTAFVPTFGRRGPGVPRWPLPSSRFALFDFEDIGESGLNQWLSEYDGFRRSLGLLSALLFREGGTVEVEMLQVAVALEALGYSLASSNTQRKASFERTVTRIADNTDCNLEKVFGEFGDIASWVQAFNAAYIAVKHADHATPIGSKVHARASEGALLARLWLARHLGVSRETLEARAHAYYV